MVVVVDEGGVEVELVEVELAEDELVEDDEVDVLVLGGRLEVVVVVVGAGVELVVDVDDVVTVVERLVLLLEVEVLVEAGCGCVVRVVLVVVEITRARLVDVVLAATGGSEQLAGAEALRAVKCRGWSRFTEAPSKSMQ